MYINVTILIPLEFFYSSDTVYVISVFNTCFLFYEKFFLGHFEENY